MNTAADDFNRLLANLDPNDALPILIELGKVPETRMLIVELAKARLVGVDIEAITNAVFAELNSIDVHDLWDASGKGYYGYNDPVDVAGDMLEHAINPYLRDMEVRHKLGFFPAERAYCIGVVSGLLKYAEDGDNEFRDWVPDYPYTAAKNVVYDWATRNPSEDVEALKNESGLS